MYQWILLVYNAISLIWQIVQSLMKRKDLTPAQKAQILVEKNAALKALHDKHDPKPYQDFVAKYSRLCTDGVCDFTADTPAA
jgi:hypothetical protein